MDNAETVNPENDQAPKRAWASHVSRLLGSCGFERATSESASMRNMTYYTPGFDVRGCNQSWEDGFLNDAERDAGYITVDRQTLDTHGHERHETRPRAEVVAEDIAAYTTALESAGYIVEVRSKGNRQYLVVTGRVR